MNNIDPKYEYIDAPKQVDFSALHETEQHLDSWFDSYSNKPEDFQQFLAESQQQNHAFDEEFQVERNEIQAEELEAAIHAEQVQSESDLTGRELGTSSLPRHSTGPRQPKWDPQLTVPVSPFFRTANRVRHNFGELPQVEPKKPSFQLGKLTVPESPALLTDHRLKRKQHQMETTEEIQMKKAQQEMDQSLKRRKMQEQLRVKASIPSTYLPERSTRPLTNPVEFRFKTEERIRHQLDTTQPAEEEERKSKAQKTWNGELTLTEPFQFRVDERFGPREMRDASPVLTAMEKAHQFLHQSSKWKKSAKRQNNVLPYDPTNWQPTVPETFTFETETRALLKPKDHILSSEEREELELNNMKQWRPLPLDKKVLDGTGTFRRPIEKPQPTVPEPFQFVTDSRIKEFRTSVEAEESTYKPLGSLETVKRSYEKLEPTVPQSPALSTKQRATLRSTDSFVVSQEPSTFKARPMPTFKPFEVKQVDFPLTEPTPFSLRTEERGQSAEIRLKEQIDKEIAREEKKRKFKAQPMPILDEPDFVPQRTHAMLTEPEPFPLKTDERGLNKSQKFLIRVDEEFQREAEQRNFKARPFVTKLAYQPVKSTKPLTEVDDRVLNSDVRAVKRQAYDNELAEKQREYEELKKQAEAEKQERDRRGLEELRKKLQFKAQPVRHGKPVHIRASTAPLTEAQSPMLRTKKRVHGMRDL